MDVSKVWVPLRVYLSVLALYSAANAYIWCNLMTVWVKGKSAKARARAPKHQLVLSQFENVRYIMTPKQFENIRYIMTPKVPPSKKKRL